MVDKHVKAMILCSILHETLEDIEGTNLYKQRLKKTCNDFKKELERVIDKTFDNVDDKVTSTSYIYEISEKIDKLI